MSKDPIFDDISRNFGDTEIEEICARLAKAILSLEATASTHLTFQTFLSILGKIELDIAVVAAVNFLSSSKHSILESHALLIDEDGVEYELEDADFQIYLSDGVVIHPVTGEQVENASEQLAPFYSRSERT